MPAWVSRELLIQASYFVTAVLFIVGLKFLSHPAKARNGCFTCTSLERPVVSW